MISAAQIRAARAFLDWSTVVLAEKVGLTNNGINKIERGHVNAQRETLETLQTIFEQHGLEFIPGSGIRRKDRTVTLIRGVTANSSLALDIYDTLKNGGGEVCIISDESIASANLDQAFMENQFRKREEAHIKHKLLIPESKESLYKSLHNNYKRLEPAYIPPCPFFIYGPKLALLIPEYTPKVLIIDHPDLSETARKLFNFVWDHAGTRAQSARSSPAHPFMNDEHNPKLVHINGEQIRSARAFLDWSTADLATQSGIAVSTINKIERGHVVPHQDTLSLIQKTFEDSGIEFLPLSGLKKKEQIPLVWEDNNACHRLFDDIFFEMRDIGGEVLISGITETNCSDCVGEQKLRTHLELLSRHNVHERVIVKSGDTAFYGAPETYHWMDEHYFSPETICIYNTKIALVTWDPQRVIIINDARMSESLRRLFNFVWDHTKPTIL